MTMGKLSAGTRETIRVAGLTDGACRRPSQACIHALSEIDAVTDDARLLALAELWLQQATNARGNRSNNVRLNAWLEAARHAYAYLFFTDRTPGQRAFERPANAGHATITTSPCRKPRLQFSADRSAA